MGMIASLSGIRGVLNEDMTLDQLAGYCGNFARAMKSDEVLLARDSRITGPAICKAAAAAMMAEGAKVLDCGMISTPALFRESRLRGRPAVMVSASHNEPQYNGLKFLSEGRGVGKETFDLIMEKRERGSAFGGGNVASLRKTAYVDDLAQRFGEGSLEGVRVALDLGGGAAISHAVKLLRLLGCEVLSVNDAPGIFNRKVDPVADDLLVLRKLVKEDDSDVGLGFDCDGDRLVIVDSDGKKRTGDYMLTLSLAELLRETGEKKAVVSLDTTLAVDDVVSKLGGEVFRSRVGEANVVAMMREKGARLGGEGSSGGLIDGSFNYCRDSMLAALLIIRAIKERGRGAYASVPTYHQERVALQIPKQRAARAIRKLEGKYDADTTDGMKVSISKKSWVLIRPSGTEDVVRVSAEAETASKAAAIAKSFASKLKELSK